MHSSPEKSASANKPKAVPSIRKARTILKHCAKSGNPGPLHEVARLFLNGTFKIDNESRSTVELLADTLDQFKRTDHADYFRSTLCNLKVTTPPKNDAIHPSPSDQNVPVDEALAPAPAPPTLPRPPPPPPLKPGPAEEELERVLRAEVAIHAFLLPMKACVQWSEQEERENEVHIDARIRVAREKEIVEAFQNEFRSKFSGYISGHGCGSIKSSAPDQFPHARVQAVQQARECAARVALSKLYTLCKQVQLQAAACLEREVCAICTKWHRERTSDSGRNLALSRVHDLIRHVDEGLLVGTRVFAFGSTTSGLALSSSDVDVSVVFPGLSASDHDKGEDDFGARDSRVCALRALERAAVVLRMKSVTLADHARVPVLRYYDPVAKVDVDVTAGNDSSILLSRFIRSHVTHDPRVWSLCMVVKAWAKNRDVSGTMHKFINPLGWSVMVIFFLQHIARPRIADLFHVYRSSHNAGGDPTQAQVVRMPWKSHLGDGHSQAKPGALLSQFFHFFGYEFDFRNEAISLNLSNRSSIVDLLGKKSSSALFIEQPLQLRENIVSYVDHQNMKLTVVELKRAADICNVEGNLDYVLCPEDEE